MKIILRGVRGSIPTTSPDTKYFGGNTSCVEVESEDCPLVLDAGTGIQYFNRGNNEQAGRVDVLLTHLHIDHIQGLGFFRPLFNSSMEVHIWGPASSAQSLRSRLMRYFSPPLFPVHFRNLSCKLFLHEVENSSFTIGPFTIRSGYVIHPGPTVGYRINDGRAVFTYIPDHEPALGRRGMPHDTKWLSGSDLAMNADLLLHDAQYTAEEYTHRTGWGHSSVPDAVHFAAQTGVKHLLLSHHDPLHTDAQLMDIFRAVKKDNPYAFKYELAVEGQQIEL